MSKCCYEIISAYRNAMKAQRAAICNVSNNVHRCLWKEQFEWLKIIMVWEIWYDRNRNRAAILFVLLERAFDSHECDRTSFRGDSTSQIPILGQAGGEKGCLRSEELLSNCCPAKPLLTKPPIKHYRGYQEAVDHFHGFARATLIQNALILRSYILAWYVLMHGIMHAIAN